MPNGMTDSFEGNLAALRPAPATVNQASFYFRAGQVSRDRAVGTWQRIGGASMLLLFATVGVSFWRITEAEARATEAEAKRSQPPLIIPAPSVEAVVPSPAPSPVFVDDDQRPYAPPMTPREPETSPTPSEVATTLELRRNILTAGTTYLDAQTKRRD